VREFGVRRSAVASKCCSLQSSLRSKRKCILMLVLFLFSFELLLLLLFQERVASRLLRTQVF